MSKLKEYLARKQAQETPKQVPAEPSAPAAQTPSALETGLAKFSQGASLGFGDELAGGLEAVGSLAGLRGLGGDFSDIRGETPEENAEDFQTVYRKGRDARRKGLEAAEKAHPVIAKGAEVAGGVTTGLATGGLGSASRLGILGKEAALGAAQGYGESDAEDLKTQGKDALKGAAISGLFAIPGAVLSGGKEGLKEFAEKRATKALAPTLNQQELLARKGMDKALGRELLDAGVVKFGSSVDDMAPRLDDLLSSKGRRIGEIRASVDETAPDGLLIEHLTRKADELKKAAATSNTAEQGMARSFGRNAKSLSGRPSRSVADWQDEVSKLNKQIPFHKPPSEFTPEQRALDELRRDLVSGVDDHIGKVRPDLANEHAALKEQFGLFREGDKILDKSVARQARNRDFSLTDYMAGDIGKAIDSPVGAGKEALYMVLNKLARERGNAALAKGADSLSKAIPEGLDKALLAAGRGADTAAIDAATSEQEYLAKLEKERGPEARKLAEYLLKKGAAQKSK
jgi:hypothetical protein